MFSNVWVILPRNFQIVLECFDWIARWTLFVYKLEEFVTFAFVWAELTGIISRGKTDFTESPTADLATNARVSWSSFYKFFVDVRAENLVGSPEVTGPRENAFWNQSPISTSMHGNWYERLAEFFSLDMIKRFNQSVNTYEFTCTIEVEISLIEIIRLNFDKNRMWRKIWIIYLSSFFAKILNLFLFHISLNIYKYIGINYLLDSPDKFFYYRLVNRVHIY